MLTPLLQLKLAILSRGITIDAAAAAALAVPGSPLSSEDYATTRGIPMHLGGSVYVNAPYLERFARGSPYVLTAVEHRFSVLRPGGSAAQPVSVFRLPDYYTRYNKVGRLYRDIVNTHTDRARINPILGCAMHCAFCDAPSRPYRRHAISEMVEAVTVAAADRLKPATHVLISGGTPTRRDEAYMNEVYRTLTAASPLPVDVMLSPRDDLEYPFRLAEWGVNDLFVNVEGTNESSNAIHMPQKHKIGLEHYFAFITQAVKAFGTGRVMSLILVGIESLEDTVAGVRRLAQIACIPVLSSFRPAIHTTLVDHEPPTQTFLAEALERCSAAAGEYGIALGPKCTPCNHNTLTPERELRNNGGGLACQVDFDTRVSQFIP